MGSGHPSGPPAAPALPITSAAGFYNMLSPAAAAAAVRNASSGAGVGAAGSRCSAGRGGRSGAR
jgi:hypothetical protein